MKPFDKNDVKIANVRTFANWNETAICFNDSRLVCSNPKTANLKQYEKVMYAPDCTTPVYGIVRLAPEPEKQEQTVSSAGFYYPKEVYM